MAITAFQRKICRLIADNRRASGESYVAGGVALNELIRSSRISRDVDLFHDTVEALNATWEKDRQVLENAKLTIDVTVTRGSFIAARISDGSDSTELQWATDTAYRFFPLVEHSDFGLTLHPFDLATNKVLALVGRLAIRDWVDAIACHDRLQPLGYLAWAACGKDLGFSPASILEEAWRSSRYSWEEFNEVRFDGERPDLVELSQKYRVMLAEAKALVELLPYEEVCRCVLDSTGNLYRGTHTELTNDLAAGKLRFHSGSIRGAYPTLVT